MKLFPVAALLLATLSIAVAQPQRIEAKPALELEFRTDAGKAYQVESSADAQSWMPHGAVIFGDGAQARLFAQASGARGFFQIATHEVRNLNSILEPILRANNVPALACAVVRSNRIIALGAVGVRKSGVPNAPVTTLDKWHHGSITKSMTATLAAMMVEEGKLRWDSTLADVFPEWAPKMHADWRKATLEQLASNRGGAPGDLGPSGIWTAIWNFPGTPRDARRLLLERLTALPPSSTPGTKYEYSNAGFALAGHMLETMAGRDWEDLLTEKLFIPLGMASAGFGVPSTPRHINQPWGHQWVSGRANPIEPGTSADNPPAIGPAGTVHCSVIDLAKYAAFHVAGHRGDTPLLKHESVLKLHTAYPNNERYAHGWSELDRPWAIPGKAYHHAGSNLQWYSVIWFAPARDFAVVALCNMASASGANPAAAATDQIAAATIQMYLSN